MPRQSTGKSKSYKKPARGDAKKYGTYGKSGGKGMRVGHHGMHGFKVANDSGKGR